MRIYAAGGAVRDLLLGRPPEDKDFSFAGTEEEFLRAYPQARKVTDSPRSIWIDKGHEYTQLQGGVPAADLARRDFTCNAFLLAENGMLHAHPTALADLQEKIIRPASPTALQEEPVRVFRAARFCACMPEFSVHPDCTAQMRRVATENTLEKIPAEQVGKEVRKACLGENPGNFLRLLDQTGCLAPWIRELADAGSLPAGPPAFHDSSVLEHTAAVMDAAAAAARTLSPTETALQSQRRVVQLTVWMALCHDLGKTTTETHLLPHHYAHEKRGEPLALALAARLRLPVVFHKAGCLASRHHMQAGQYDKLRLGTRVDLLNVLLASHLFLPFALFVTADARTPELFHVLQRDAALIRQVRLSEKWQNKGAISGTILREMQCRALAEARTP